MGVALLHVVFFCIVVITLVGYPYSYDWAEGGMADQVLRVLSGKPLYVKPSLDFIPFMYPPLYMYLSALASSVLGVGLAPLRVVSLAAAAGTFSVVYLFVRRESGSAYYGILASGLLAGSFISTGVALNLARVDQLFLFLFLAGAYLVKFHPSRYGYMAAALLFSLSFLTKQTALVASFPLLLYAFVTDSKKSLYLIIPAFIIAGGSTLLLDRIHEGWYSFYVFKLPGSIPFEKSMLMVFLKQDLMVPLTIACVTSLFFIVSRISSDRNKGLFYLMFATGALAGSWLSRLNLQAALNVDVPAYAVISILFALGVHDAMKKIGSSVQGTSGLVGNFAMSVFLLQLVLLLYNPLKDRPTKMDMEAGSDFVKVISQFNGEVFAPYNSYIPVLAGKRSYPHAMSFYEIMRSADSTTREQLMNGLRQAIFEKKFDAIVIYPAFFADGFVAEEELKQNYEINKVLSYDGTKYWPSKERDTEIVYVRK